MKKNISPRDLMQLSAYLDGELSASASRKMKSRLAHDPNLAAALDDLRDTRSILRRIPHRRAPRNFTLSPQMVAKRPSIPRLVPALNYASLLAMLLFFMSFVPSIGFGGAMAPAAEPEMMMEAPAMEMAVEEAPAEEAPAEEMPAMEAAAEEAPMEDAAAPAAEEPVMEEAQEETVTEGEGENAMGAAATIVPTEKTTDDAEKTVVTQSAEDITALPTDSASGALAADLTATPSKEDVRELLSEPFFTSWQKILLAAIFFFPILAYALRQVTIAKWKNTKS